MRTYQGRWLGIWSPEDEAINGLRTTIQLSISFVSRMSLRESVLFSDWLSLVSRPYHWILIRFYNTLLRPLLDGIVRSHVVKTALGNNRPGAEVIAVSPAPIESIEAPCLPDWLHQKISAEADRHARDIAPKLRRLAGGAVVRQRSAVVRRYDDGPGTGPHIVLRSWRGPRPVGCQHGLGHRHSATAINRHCTEPRPVGLVPTVQAMSRRACGGSGAGTVGRGLSGGLSSRAAPAAGGGLTTACGAVRQVGRMAQNTSAFPALTDSQKNL